MSLLKLSKGSSPNEYNLFKVDKKNSGTTSNDVVLVSLI